MHITACNFVKTRASQAVESQSSSATWLLWLGCHAMPLHISKKHIAEMFSRLFQKKVCFWRYFIHTQSCPRFLKILGLFLLSLIPICHGCDALSNTGSHWSYISMRGESSLDHTDFSGAFLPKSFNKLYSTYIYLRGKPTFREYLLFSVLTIVGQIHC